MPDLREIHPSSRVAVGLTRPAMWQGVAFVPMLVVGLLGIYAILFLGFFNGFWVAPAGYVVLLALCKWEPRFFDIIAVWFKTFGTYPIYHRQVWRAASYTPIPSRYPDAR